MSVDFDISILKTNKNDGNISFQFIKCIQLRYSFVLSFIDIQIIHFVQFNMCQRTSLALQNTLNQHFMSLETHAE
jgi:hypothetical protein